MRAARRSPSLVARQRGRWRARVLAHSVTGSVADAHDCSVGWSIADAENETLVPDMQRERHVPAAALAVQVH
jgi:hypothetical protein